MTRGGKLRVSFPAWHITCSLMVAASSCGDNKLSVRVDNDKESDSLVRFIKEAVPRLREAPESICP